MIYFLGHNNLYHQNAMYGRDLYKYIIIRHYIYGTDIQ